MSHPPSFLLLFYFSLFLLLREHLVKGSSAFIQETGAQQTPAVYPFKGISLELLLLLRQAEERGSCWWGAWGCSPVHHPWSLVLPGHG